MAECQLCICHITKLKVEVTDVGRDLDETENLLVGFSRQLIDWSAEFSSKAYQGLGRV